MALFPAAARTVVCMCAGGDGDGDDDDDDDITSMVIMRACITTTVSLTITVITTILSIPTTMTTTTYIVRHAVSHVKCACSCHTYSMREHTPYTVRGAARM